MTIRKRRILFLFTGVFVCFPYVPGNSAPAPSASPPARSQCQALSAQQLADKARSSSQGRAVVRQIYLFSLEVLQRRLR